MKLKKKVSHHNHDKYITTAKLNNLAAGVFTARLAQEIQIIFTKTDFDTKLQDKFKHFLVENELKKTAKI